MSHDKCPYCTSTSTEETTRVTERMFGSYKSFVYARCGVCRSIRLVDAPDNLSEHYPPTYYSQSRAAFPSRVVYRVRLHRAARRIERIAERLTGLRTRFGGDPPPWLKLIQLDRSARVLDVGCGAGEALLQLAREGFTDMTGIDPFLLHDHHVAELGVKIIRGSLDDFRGGDFDLVTFHHSLEHIADPYDAVVKAKRLLKNSDSALLVRVPLIDSLAFERYGDRWVQWDAPRHLTVPTRRGVTELAKRSGFRVSSLFDDSESFSFWGSELYQRGVPLVKDGLPCDPYEHFSPEELGKFELLANEANRNQVGDQAVFLLTLT